MASHQEIIPENQFYWHGEDGESQSNSVQAPPFLCGSGECRAALQGKLVFQAPACGVPEYLMNLSNRKTKEKKLFLAFTHVLCNFEK